MFQSVNIKVVILVTLLNLFFLLSLRIFASYYLSSFTSFSVDTLSRYVQIKGLLEDYIPAGPCPLPLLFFLFFLHLSSAFLSALL